MDDMFKALFGIIFAALASGNASQFMGDIVKAESALQIIFNILKLRSIVDIKSRK